MEFKGHAITAVLAPLALGVALLGAWTVAEENAGAVFDFGLTSVGQVVRTIGDDQVGGLWTRTQQSVLKNCERALLATRSLEVRYLPTQTQEALVPHCRQTAETAAARFPTDSYAWSVSALAAAHMQDWPGMNDALIRSQLTGPHEGWIAELRVAVAQDNFAQLEAEALEAADADLRLLLASESGIGTLAQRYVDEPDFRARVEAQVETQPAQIQRRFINEVRKRTTS
ncbi:hypothetical protein [Devosia sediminis]|uniref:Uncharacterized protein n=1 Tax=Devosia sediminis TaxID=2798801 RepID=A0A934MFR6_9HYPH|nr:hypothetical protein [Devosia sediminis]MBJ3783122.1 hypothetical protein [Devosia sediminis]